MLQPLIHWSSTLTSDIQQIHKAGAKLQHVQTRINVVRMRQVMGEKGTSSQHVAVTKCLKYDFALQGYVTGMPVNRVIKLKMYLRGTFQQLQLLALTHTLHFCSVTCKHLLLSI